MNKPAPIDAHELATIAIGYAGEFGPQTIRGVHVRREGKAVFVNGEKAPSLREGRKLFVAAMLNPDCMR